MHMTSTLPAAGWRPRRPSPAAARRRRVVAATAAAALGVLALGVHGVVTDPGSGPASAAGIGPLGEARHVVAHPGDSLWSIAERHHGDVAFRHYLDALIELNGGTAIQAGQAVRLP